MTKMQNGVMGLLPTCFILTPPWFCARKKTAVHVPLKCVASIVKRKSCLQSMKLQKRLREPQCRISDFPQDTETAGSNASVLPLFIQEIKWVSNKTAFQLKANNCLEGDPIPWYSRDGGGGLIPDAIRLDPLRVDRQERKEPSRIRWMREVRMWFVRVRLLYTIYPNPPNKLTDCRVYFSAFFRFKPTIGK